MRRLGGDHRSFVRGVLFTARGADCAAGRRSFKLITQNRAFQVAMRIFRSVRRETRQISDRRQREMEVRWDERRPWNVVSMMVGSVGACRLKGDWERRGTQGFRLQSTTKCKSQEQFETARVRDSGRRRKRWVAVSFAWTVIALQ